MTAKPDAKREWDDKICGLQHYTFPGMVRIWRVWDADGAHDFDCDEYTLKVEFVKKRKPLRVGDHVFCMGVRGVIDAIATSNGPVRECWVRDEDTGQHTTISEVILSRVGEI